MYNKEEIEDSLAFCREIEIYRRADREREQQKEAGGAWEEPEQQEEKIQEYQWELSRLEQAGQNARPTTESTSLRVVNNVFMVAVCLLLGFFIASLITGFVAYQTTVEGESMEPTLSDGDSVIIQKIQYYWAEPRRYDVVVFPVKSPKGTEKNFYVKRIIGLPGETVQIKEGAVYINGKKLDTDTYCLSRILDPGGASDPVKIGKGEYFVLGDNRNMSTDSRSSYVGLVKRKDIAGKVFLRIWPFSGERKLWVK